MNDGMDTFLKVWAIFGPLLAAILSAIWARRNQVADRRDEDRRDEVRRHQIVADVQLEREAKIASNRLERLRSAYASFRTAQFRYMNGCVEIAHGRSPEEVDAVRLMATFVNAYEVLYLLLGPNQRRLLEHLNGIIVGAAAGIRKQDFTLYKGELPALSRTLQDSILAEFAQLERFEVGLNR